MRINGAQMLIECLVEQGVDTVFGYPGEFCAGHAAACGKAATL